MMSGPLSEVMQEEPYQVRLRALSLAEFAVPHTIISVMETAVDERWLGWLLDLIYGRPLNLGKIKRSEQGN